MSGSNDAAMGPRSVAPPRATRREALKVGAAVVGGVACSSGFDFGLQEGDSFDQVLDAIHRTGPDFDDGLSNHAPMAAEALEALGYSSRVVSFVNVYGENHDLEAPSDPDRNAIAPYEKDLSERSIREVIESAWVEASAGYVTAGFHGVLRTAHALRSLEREDTASRRRELAHGLGYWSAVHRRLSGEPGSEPEAGFDVLQALAEVPLVPGNLRAGGGLISDQLTAVDRYADFAATVMRVDVSALPVSETITQLAAAAARLFVADGGGSIGYLHAVTGSSALRLFLPWLDETAQRIGLGYAFQAVAAVHATYGSAAGVPETISPAALDPEALFERARTSSDEHTVKLIEACLREHAIDPRPEFLAAAAAWNA